MSAPTVERRRHEHEPRAFELTDRERAGLRLVAWAGSWLAALDAAQAEAEAWAAEDAP